MRKLTRSKSGSKTTGYHQKLNKNRINLSDILDSINSMKRLCIGFIAFLFLASCVAQKPEQIIKEANVARLIKTLSADEMEGR